MSRHRQSQTVILHRLLHQAHQISRGFTLIEVIIVVGILLILAAIGIPTYNDYMTSAKQAKTAYSGVIHDSANSANSALNAATATTP